MSGSTTPTISTDRKSAVSTLKFAIAPLTADSATALTYGAVHEINDDLITVKYTPRMNSGGQWASGIEVDSYVSKSGGTLDVTVCALNAADEAALFGSVIDTATGTLASSKSDVVPDVMVIYSTERSDGTVNLYKFMKCKFTSQGENAQTRDENNITYNTQALQASYKATIKNGVEMYSRKGISLSTEAGRAEYAAWFATALGGIPAPSGS